MIYKKKQTDPPEPVCLYIKILKKESMAEIQLQI